MPSELDECCYAEGEYDDYDEDADENGSDSGTEDQEAMSEDEELGSPKCESHPPTCEVGRNSMSGGCGLNPFCCRCYRRRRWGSSVSR